MRACRKIRTEIMKIRKSIRTKQKINTYKGGKSCCRRAEACRRAETSRSAETSRRAEACRSAETRRDARAR